MIDMIDETLKHEKDEEYEETEYEKTFNKNMKLNEDGEYWYNDGNDEELEESDEEIEKEEINK
jgi:hypothetical protein